MYDLNLENHFITIKYLNKLIIIITHTNMYYETFTLFSLPPP